MDDFPTKIADLLESSAQKVRSLTVDRIARISKWAALGMVIAILVIVGLFFILIGVFRILGELMGMRTTYAVVGGLFALAGAFLWSRRTSEPKEDEE